MLISCADANLFVHGGKDDCAISETGEMLAADSPTLRIGFNPADPAGGVDSVLSFSLPVLPPGATISAARISVTAKADGNFRFRGDLWSAGFASDEASTSSYLAASRGNAGEAKLAAAFLKPGLDRFQRVTSAVDQALAAHLSGFYRENPDYRGGTRAFFRIRPGQGPRADSGFYTIKSADSSESIERPVLYLVLDGKEPVKRPNLIVLVTDDQRWDAVGVMQKALAAGGRVARFPWLVGHTPGMDRLANEGVRFDNAFVTFSLCSPSRTCMLTGRYPHLSGVMDNLTSFPTQTVTYATLLRDSGYATGYFGKWHHHNQKERPGFDSVATFLNQGNYFGNTYFVNGKPVMEKDWVDGVSTRYLLDFIERQSAAGQPFMAFIGFKSPHDPRIPAKHHEKLFESEKPESVPNLNLRPSYRKPDAPDSSGELADTLNYFEVLAGVDDNVVRLLKHLDDLGIAENTAVAYLSDNGYFLGEHGIGDKRAAYEESLRIPFLLRFPAMKKAPVVSNELVLNLDLAPTLLEFAGVPVPAEMQGRSLAPLVAGNVPKPAWRDSFFYYYTRDPAYPDAVPDILTLRYADGRKITRYPANPSWTEFFDVARDPYETRNLAQLPESGPTLRVLEDQLDQAATDARFNASQIEKR
jgi:arylsulfatase A-like enzyme